jgi:hypothetical protein
MRDGRDHRFPRAAGQDRTDIAPGPRHTPATAVVTSNEDLPGLDTRSVTKDRSSLPKSKRRQIWCAACDGLGREGAANIVALLVIIAIGVSVRAYHLSVPLKFDEAWTFLDYARQPLWDGISNYSNPNNHVLNTVLMHLSISWFGNHDWSLRLSDFVFGCLVIPVTYVLARILSNSEAALVAAALVAGSSKLVEYSVNARGYTLLVFLSIVLVAIGFRLISTTKVMVWAAFTGVAALGFLTIPTMLYVYAAVVLWISIKCRWDRIVIGRILIISLVTLLITAVLYLSVLLHFGLRSGVRALLFNAFVQPLALHDFLRQVHALPLALLDSWTTAVPDLVLIAVLIGCAVAMFTDRDVLQLLLSFVVAVMGLIAFQRVLPPSRVFLFGLPIVAICAASGLLHLSSRWRGDLRFPVLRISAVVLAAWMGWTVLRSDSVIASEETGSFPDAAEVINFLNVITMPTDLVLMIMPTDQPFKYYLQSRAMDWEQGSGGTAFSRLLIVIRDHHGPVPSRDWPMRTLSDISRLRFYTTRSEPKSAFTGPYTSVYIADGVGATVEHEYCEFFCFHRTRN